MSVHAIDLNHGNIIVETFPDLLWSKRYADVAFVCRDSKMVQAHRLLLGAISPFLRELFDDQASRDMIQISLPDCDVGDLNNVLRFAYEGVVRLDKSELEEFKKVNLMLGLKISTELLDSNSGETIEDDGDNMVHQDNNITEDRDNNNVTEDPDKNQPVNKTECDHSNNLTSPRRRGLKRKCDDNEDNGNSKAKIIDSINHIVSNLSKGPASQPDDQQRPKEKPVLVPMKYLPKFLATIERLKAEKRLEELIEAYVKKHLLGLKRQKRNKKHSEQEKDHINKNS